MKLFSLAGHTSLATRCRYIGLLVGSLLVLSGHWSAHAQITNIGHALSFDGTTNAVVVSSGFTGFPSNAITVELWVRSTNTTKSGSLVSFATPGDANTFLIYDHRNLSVWVNNGASVNTGVGINDGAWHHLAVTWSTSGNLQLFKDGVLAYSTNNFQIGASMDTSGTLILGQDQDSFGGGFDPTQALLGEIDEVRIWSVVRTPAEITQNRVNLLVGNEPNLAAYYRFNEGIGTNTFDGTGFSHHGVLRNGVSWMPHIPYNPGTALNLTNGFVAIPHAPSLNAFPLTISGWLRTSSTQSMDVVISKYVEVEPSEGEPNGYQLFLENGVLKAFYFLNGSYRTDFRTPGPTGGSVNDGLWHHVAFTVDASGGKLYVDGTLQATRPWLGVPGPIVTTNTLAFGSSGANGFPGQLDEVSLWNAALDAAALHLNMNRRLTGSEPNLVALYHFDEVTGALVTDASGHGNNGALQFGANFGASLARIQGLAQLGGRVTSAGAGLANTPIMALLPPVGLTVSQPIPDNATLISSNTVTQPGAIGAVRVNVNLNHPYRGDLELTLIHPDGTEVRLKNADGTDEGADLVTSFPDQTESSEALTVLSGKAVAGIWRLRVRDAFPLDSGTLNTWSLQFGPTPVLTDANGMFTFNNLIAGLYTVQPVRDGFTFNPPNLLSLVDRTNVNFSVLSGFVSGRVIGAGGAALTVRSASGLSALTDDAGNYRLNGLPPGNQTIFATNFGFGITPPQLANVPLGTTTANFNVSAYPVAGRITNVDSNGVSGITVFANSSPTSATTDAQGHYVIPQVPLGASFIAPVQSGFTFLPSGMNIAVSGARSNINFTAVSSPPTITTIPNQVIALNGSTGPLRFDVNDAETRPALLQMSALSSNPTLVPVSNVVFGGVGIQRTVTITPAPNQFGIANLTIIVTDESGLTASTSLNLRVNQLPQPGAGLALSFNGVNQAANANTNVIGDKGTFSVEAWAYAPSNSGPRTILAQGAGFTIGVDAAGQIRVGTNWNTGVAFPFGGWHHLAVVRETANTRLYLDGILSASRGSAIPFPSQSALFQVGALANGENWLGVVDEVRVWRVARSAAEINGNRTMRVTGNEPNLAGLWRFDEPTGPAVDTSTGGHNLAITGAVRVPSPVRFDPYVTPLGRNITDQLQGHDADGDPLTFALVSPPVRGTVTLLNSNTGAFRYTADSTGEDQFTFSLNDGYATSSAYPVTIQVLPDTNPPSISFLANQTVAEDAVLGPVAFIVGDSERASELLTVFGSSSDQTLVPDGSIVIAGTGTNRSFTLQPATNQFGTATITLTVSDGAQTAASSFTLTVTPVNDPPVISPLTNQVVRRDAQNFGQFFTVQDVDSPIDGIVIQAGSDNPSVATTYANYPNGDSGIFRSSPADPNARIAISSSAFNSGTATVTVTAADGEDITSRSHTVIVNDPPTIAAIPNQTTYRNLPTTVAILLSDVDDPVGDATLTASSTNLAVVDDKSFAFSGSGANRTLVITPIGERTGQARITVTARDAYGATAMSFLLTVEEKPEYVVTELPMLPGWTGVNVRGLNDRGQIVGWATGSGSFIRRAALWDVSGNAPTATELFQDQNSAAFAVNADRYTVGRKSENTLVDFTAFLLAVGPAIPIGDSGVSHAEDINDAGAVVGVANLPAGVIFYRAGNTNLYLTNVFSAGDSPIAGRTLAMNQRGDVLGRKAGDSSKAQVWRLNDAGIRELRDLTAASGNGLLTLAGINNFGQVCISREFPGALRHPIIYNYQTDQTNVDLRPVIGAKFPGYSAEATHFNDAGEVIGVLSAGDSKPFLYSAGVLIDVRDLVPSGTFGSFRPAAINASGEIAGTGTRPGSSVVRPFLLSRRWVVGRPIAPPPAAINPLTQNVYRSPGPFVATDGTPAEQVAQSAFWSPVDRCFYLLRPMRGNLTWYTSPDVLDTNAPVIVQSGTAVWPTAPQIHIATAPVELRPVTPTSPYRPVAMSYSTSAGATFDPSTSTFNAATPGYSVIRYLLAPEIPIDGSPDILTHSNYFEVVRTVAWNDPAYLRDSLPATVGVKASDPRGTSVATNSPKSGWTIFPTAPYDGAGADRAYDRATQTGPIIPVNQDTAAANDDLVVAFYKESTLTGTLWPDLAARFAITWPTNAEKLVIANPVGSGPLPEAFYPEKRVYNQPIRGLPGFNPNEEHAFLAPTSAGQGVFALRNDLNGRDTSPNFVLLKYRNPTNSEWQFKLYQPTLTDATHDFQFTVEAGKEILPPYPLGLFPVCSGTTNWSGKAFRDYQGKFYATTGPTPADPYPEIGMRYSYPLQPDFYYDLNNDGINDLPVGTCIEWKTQPAPTIWQPVDVRYRVRWPAEAPELQIGETLLDPKRGLPGIKNWASAQIIFDSLNPSGQTPLESSVRLYDPLSARTLRLTNIVSASYQFPPEITLQTVGGKQIFAGLPYYLRSRLSYDPVNQALSFAGFLDATVVGEPLLLVNVLSGKERDRIKLLSGEANFQRIIDALYDLTRNPNGVSVAHPGVPPADQSLLIGFTTKYTAVVTNGFGTNATTTSQEFFGVRPSGNNLRFIATNIVQEPLGDLPKALTAGLPVPTTNASFGGALQFNGTSNGFAYTYTPIAAPQTFTLSLWFRTTATQNGVLLNFGDSAQGPFADTDRKLSINSAGQVSFYVYDSGGKTITSTNTFRDGQWHHVAATLSDLAGMRLYVDGNLVAQNPNVTFAYTYPAGGYWRIGQNFNGNVDDVQIWDVARTQAQIQQGRMRPLTGGEAGLSRYWRCDETSGAWLIDDAGIQNAFIQNGANRVSSSIPSSASATRYVVLAENNDAALGSLPVTLHVIRLDGGLFRGDLKILFPDNVFDERLALRHSPDFGADPDRLEFEWWYHPDAADFDPVALPILNPDGSIADARGWLLYSPALTPNKNGQNTITIGDGGETSQFTLADNWFISRYRGYSINGQTNWSAWIGDPASAAQTRAAFAPGWVKRVIEGINPFEARTTNFHQTAASTFASMLIQAGQRYEGNIALNPSGANLSSIGLIEAYTTVLNRGRNLSIDGAPPVDSDPLNNALLLAASRISDLYMLLGNEAFADAQDPTIGFLADDPELGALATSTFAFKNQLDSQLEEELVLLRGRDDSAAGVGGRPVYNRLLWNFTGSEGEVAYQRTYNITDVNADGVINEFDARVLYPQGHGDAWGHYLSAIKTYYELLRHPRFTWVPRPENVLIAGTAVRVDFLDERKFASAAVAKAKAGAELVDLTYRSKYVDDPEGQYQGYKDTRADRAWGVTEWARRADQGAYFDWLVGNAILPGTDPNTNHTGIQKIDRQTVRELDEIISQHQAIQAQMDKADAGLNPLGLAKGAVTFDIDPNFDVVGSGIQGQRHFQQIYDRAVKALNNSQAVWNQANKLSEALRRKQDTIDEFTANVSAQERDYKNRLIEIFGYPYAGDIGAGKAYPSGYDGPDLYHYMYVGATELTGAASPPTNLITGYFAPFPEGTNAANFYFGDDLSAGNFSPGPVLNVPFPLAKDGWAFTAPTSFGSRRAPGELQLALSDLLQEETRLKIALGNYDSLTRKIQESATLLQSRIGLSTTTLNLLTQNTNRIFNINNKIQALQDAQLGLRRIASITDRLTTGLVEGIPTGGDTLVPFGNFIRAGILIAGGIVIESLETAADISEGQQNRQERAKEETQLQTDLNIEVASQNYEIKQQAAELLSLFRDESTLRLEAFNQAELVKQSLGRYQSALAAGQRLIQERIAFRQRVASDSQRQRYEDMAFRVFRNEALQKYRAQFDLAARFVYLAATAYDYEMNFLGADNRSGRDFFTDIIRQRSLGLMIDGEPVAGSAGLADPLGRLSQNFDVLQSRFGLNNPQLETSRFSLRRELFRIRDDADSQWRATLRQAVVQNLWEVPEFRRYCRPFAPESAGPQPGLVIRFPTTITFGLNFFGFPLGGGDSAYDPSLFSTKINSVGVWFEDYNSAGLAVAPRVYLVPAGMDVQRSPTGNTLATREWRIVDQAIPVPFPIGDAAMQSPAWIPMNDSLSESLAQIRRFSSFRAYHDAGVYDDTEATRTTRLIGRSVWNTDWLLIIPGGTFQFDPTQGLDTFINSVGDIKISLQSYSYSGD
ncbi:MAG TPA: LamG-like jellyroll fold domain-containing protein [Verrucomicrobiae bacterium]|nr:LamG-like jellyroll fold domain-containing protein [Verrucomicrobiae bacterium]